VTEEELQTSSEETPVELIGEEIPADDPVSVETMTTEEEGVTVNVTIEQPAAAAAAPEDDEAALVEDGEIAADDPASVRTFSVTSLDVLEDPQSGDVPQVMVDVIESVLGEYQRMTYTVTVVDSDGTVVGTSTEYVPGLAGLDYCWLAGAALFLVFFTGCFKLLGGLIR